MATSIGLLLVVSELPFLYGYILGSVPAMILTTRKISNDNIIDVMFGL